MDNTNRLIECVPNFSEGNDLTKIQAITDSIESIPGVRLLNVDPGKATNRTVVTFVGDPDSVIEAAFKAIKKAGEIIDMRYHKGAHPRMGATDVCPLIPIRGISMEETAHYAKKLGERLGREIGLSVYLYEEAQENKQRSNLSHIRAGEYEGFKEKILIPEWKPDFGPAHFDEKRGATVVGARDFLIAYNINLNTQSVQRANSVAFDVRETGRVLREGNSTHGKEIRDEKGNPVWVPGSLKSVKAMGWYIEEYGIAQISMNLTNIRITPLHIAFDEVCKKAINRGLRVTGSELVGLVPLNALIDTARYFLSKQKRSSGLSEKELVQFAIRTLGLNELSPFIPEERIIEYLIEEKSHKKLAGLSLEAFADETARDSPAPGGGSVSAYLGVLASSLGTMVANLSAHKKGLDSNWEAFSDWAQKGQELKAQLLKLVDEDTQAFNLIMEALSLPNKSPEEKVYRSGKLEEATLKAVQIPFQVMKTVFHSFELLEAMAQMGNPNSISDIGVAVLSARSAILGAYLNVKINAKELKNPEKIHALLKEAQSLGNQAPLREKEILEIVNKIIQS
jgi:glutamate formiminotransferase/formiminotetrahydrofolate cyclodeaminase